MASTDNVTVDQLLYPVAVVAFAVFGFFAFQTFAIIEEHNGLLLAKTQQEQPVEQAKKVQSQLDALAVGTLKLSEKGNKDAVAIIGNLKKLGITVKEPAAGGKPAAEAPLAPKAE